MLAGEVDPRSSMQRVSSESRDLISWARLLERRVSFARWAAAESCAVLSDEPKNFIKLFATDAAGRPRASGSIRSLHREPKKIGAGITCRRSDHFHRHRGVACRRTCCRGCAGGGCRLGPVRLRHVFLNIDFALEVRALFNRNPLGDDIAHCDGRLGQLGALRSADISIQLALDDHALGVYIGANLAVGPDDQPVPCKLDAALDLAIHVKVLAAREFPLDDDGLPNMRKLCRFRRLHDFGLLGHIYQTGRARESQVTCDLPGPEKLIERKPRNPSRTPFVLHRTISHGDHRGNLPKVESALKPVAFSGSGVARRTLSGGHLDNIPAAFSSNLAGARASSHETYPVPDSLANRCWWRLRSPEHRGAWRKGRPQINPGELVRRAVENEIKSNDQGPKYMCRQRKETPAGSQTKLMVETRDAMVGMVVAYNDQPLNQQQRRDEYGRIERFVNQPAELERKRKQEKESAERVNLILKALPDAFLYEYDGTETGRPGVGKSGDAALAAQVPPQSPVRSAIACGAGPDRHAGGGPG